MSTSLRLHALFASLLGATAVAVGCNGTIATEADGGAQDGGTVLPDGAQITPCSAASEASARSINGLADSGPA